MRIPVLIDPPGLDNLVAVPILGHQALTTRDIAVGDLRIAFTAETALSKEYARENDLHRESGLNKTDAVGYLEHNRRVRAIRLRGNRSDALLMPLESVAYTGVDIAQLKEGDAFDELNGHSICSKFEVAQKHKQNPAKTKIAKAFSRVDAKMLPEHVSTDNYFRSVHMIPQDTEVIVTAKYHGTSIRVSNTIVQVKPTWREKIARWFGVKVREYEYDYIHGSRKVIKDPASATQDHYYGFDLWSREGEKLRGTLPQGVILYGELVGWTGAGSAIQKGYDYCIPDGECQLFIYRISRISPDGFISDLSWDQVRQFCRERGLKHVPELWRGPHSEFNPDEWLEKRFYDSGYIECLPLSGKKLVDEGVVIRVDAIIPQFFKAKSAIFLEHESSIIDQGISDMESAA